MPASTPLTKELIDDAMIHGVQYVFNTMGRMDLSLADKSQTVEAVVDSGVQQIIGNVGFGGSINGLVYLCMPEEFAFQLTSQVLSMSKAELILQGAESINDTIGEITNMTVGTFKNRLADLGYPCKLTVPSIVRGKGLSVRGIKGASRQIFHFDYHGVRISADLHIQLES